MASILKAALRSVQTPAIDVDVGGYRDAISPLNLGDVSITEVFDPAKPNLHVTQIRIEAQEGDESVAAKTVEAIEASLGEIFGGKMLLQVKAKDISVDAVAKFLTENGLVADVSKTDDGCVAYLCKRPARCGCGGSKNVTF